MSQIARRSFMGLSLAALASAAMPAELHALAPKPLVGAIESRIDSSALDVAAAELDLLLDELPSDLPEAFLNRLLEVLERPEGLVQLRIECGPTGRARQYVSLMILKPSEFFNRLLAALRAHDWDVGVFVDFHDSSSVGMVRTSNEVRTPTESQGPVGVCPLSSQGDFDA